MMYPLSILLVVMLTILPSFTLNIHLSESPSSFAARNLTTINLRSIYSTLGTHPNVSLSSPLHLLSSKDLDDVHCTCSSNVTGHIVIMNGDLPSLRGCNGEIQGKSAALVRLLQRHGAIGVVLPAQETYMNGRMLGLAKDLKIPVLVCSRDVLLFVAENSDAILAVDIPAITQTDLNTIGLLRNVFLTWTIINIGLYCVLIILLATIVIIDAERLYKKGKYFSHNAVLKVSSFGSVLAYFLYLLFSPYSGVIETKWWHPSVAGCLHQGFYVVSLLCVVRLWILASTTSIPLVQENISYIVYSLAAVVLITAIFTGIFWYNQATNTAFLIVYLVALICAGIAFFIFGKKILVTFSASGNLSPGSKILPRKIAVFILLYIAFTIAALCVFFTQVIGAIFSLFFSSFYIALSFLAVFSLLFFPKMAKKQRKKRTPTFVEMARRRASDTQSNIQDT